jgi:hypothetical protein
VFRDKEKEMPRRLSASFFQDLDGINGLLRPVLERVKLDHTLMLAIRNGYVNIYYRGGNLLKISERGDNSYLAFFNTEYNISGMIVPDLPRTISSQDDSTAWVDAFPQLKQLIDVYLSAHNKPEREFQQLVARENNFSMISNESEYFISDIEFADSEIGTRLDMLAIRWLASQRRDGGNCVPAFIEMKFADGALQGDSGLIKHLNDIDGLINSAQYQDVLSTMEAQFEVLDKLKLLKFNRSSNFQSVRLSVNQKPEVVFILANHNPRSSKLETIFSCSAIDDFDQSENFDLKFFNSCFAGYGLHQACMYNLTEFRELLNSLRIS